MTRLAMPLAPFAVAFAAGIAGAPWISPRSAAAALVAAAASTTLVLLAGHPGHAVVPLLVAVAALGALRARPTPLPVDHVGRLALPLVGRVEGRLAEPPTRWAPDRARLVLDVDRIDEAPRSGRLPITTYGVLVPLVEGQRVAIEARLDRPVGFRNPGGFDSAARLAREGVYVTGNAQAERLVALDAPPAPWPARLRAAALGAMQARLPPVSAALLGGLLLGERTDLPAELHDAFRRAGVYHVLAVSGFNVALLAGAIWTLLRGGGAGRRVSAVGSIVAVLAFAAVVGPQPSVLRATIMAILVLAAMVLDREASVTNSLALAALAILAVRPSDLLDPGFQLSFAATAGIVVAPMPRNVVAAALAVSAAAQLAVLPIALIHFNQLSTIGVVANLAVVPLAGAATVLGLLGVAAAALADWLATPPFGAVWPILLALRGAVALAAAVPGASVHLPAPGPASCVFYVVGLAAAILAWHQRADARRCRRGLMVTTCCLAGAGGLWAWPMLAPSPGTLRVSVLDVGQGDAIVIEAPDGRAMVVDAGVGGPWRLDVGERVVAPFLWSRGVLRLATTVTTHADLDHAGGMPAVLRLFGASETWDARAPRPFGGAWLTPLTADTASRRTNDHALVLRVEVGLASILLASDIEALAEHALVQSRVPLAATVLKVAHHGAATSSTPSFLAATRPTVAVVSVGARNPYGHPAAPTLARLTASGARVYRTDRDGAILVETDGRMLTVTRWAEGDVERLCLDPESVC